MRFETDFNPEVLPGPEEKPFNPEILPDPDPEIKEPEMDIEQTQRLNAAKVEEVKSKFEKKEKTKKIILETCHGSGVCFGIAASEAGRALEKKLSPEEFERMKKTIANRIDQGKISLFDGVEQRFIHEHNLPIIDLSPQIRAAINYKAAKKLFEETFRDGEMTNDILKRMYDVLMKKADLYSEGEGKDIMSAVDEMIEAGKIFMAASNQAKTLENTPGYSFFLRRTDEDFNREKDELASILGNAYDIFYKDWGSVVKYTLGNLPDSNRIKEIKKPDHVGNLSERIQKVGETIYNASSILKRKLELENN